MSHTIVWWESIIITFFVNNLNIIKLLLKDIPGNTTEIDFPPSEFIASKAWIHYVLLFTNAKSIKDFTFCYKLSPNSQKKLSPHLAPPFMHYIYIEPTIMAAVAGIPRNIPLFFIDY